MKILLSILFLITPHISFADMRYKIGDTIGGKVWVIDGDSIRLTHPDYTKSEIRIFGVDAPEYKTDAGKNAKYYVINLVKSGDRTAACTIIDIDHYNRYVSQCFINTKNGNVDLGETLLKNGHARYFGKFMYLKSVPQWIKNAYIKYR